MIFGFFFDFVQKNIIYLYVVRRWGILEEMSLHISSKSLKWYQGEIAALKKNRITLSERVSLSKALTR